MNGTTWFLIGIATGAAGTGLLMFARALTTAFRALPAAINTVLNSPEEPEPHLDEDVWDYDLRILLTDSID